MIKVIIVEDEENILKSILYMVNWIETECLVVGTAWNGEEGLALIETEKPDIVITDVRMPFMDGLEMIQEGLKKHQFESIIISGYSNFSYAQTAIHLGVSEYILKPIDYKEIEMSLEKLREKILFKRKMLEKHSKPSYSNRVKSIIEYIDDNLDSQIRLKDLCDQFDLSSTTLNNLFKEETNTTVIDFINRRKIDRAIDLIRSEKYLVYEISEMLGFSDYKYFNRVFKKYTQKSPSDFIDKK